MTKWQGGRQKPGVDGKKPGWTWQKTWVDMAETRVDMAEARVDMAETRVDMAETRVDMAETRVDMAETRVDMAETRVPPGDGPLQNWRYPKNWIPLQIFLPPIKSISKLNYWDRLRESHAVIHRLLWSSARVHNELLTNHRRDIKTQGEGRWTRHGLIYPMFDVIRHIFNIPLQNQRNSKGENVCSQTLLTREEDGEISHHLCLENYWRHCSKCWHRNPHVN